MHVLEFINVKNANKGQHLKDVIVSMKEVSMSECVCVCVCVFERERERKRERETE